MLCLREQMPAGGRSEIVSGGASEGPCCVKSLACSPHQTARLALFLPEGKGLEETQQSDQRGAAASDRMLLLSDFANRTKENLETGSNWDAPSWMPCQPP